MKIRLSVLALAAAVVAVAGVMLVTPASGGSGAPFFAAFRFTSTLAATPAPCAELRFNVVGTGVATYLGMFDTVQHHCSTAAGPLAFTGGQYVFTGKDGDTIYGTYAGRFVPIPGTDEFRPDAHWTIDGGTGRFAGSTGGGPVTGRATAAGGIVILEGTITLPRPGKH